MKTLVKYHSTLLVQGVGTGPSYTDYDIDASGGVGFNEGWRKLNATSFVSERIIDVAGLTIEDETIFFDGITVQEGGLGSGITGQVGDSFVTMDIVASVPLDVDNDFGKILLHGAGFPDGGQSNFEHIPYSRTVRQTLDLSTSAAFAFKVSSEQSGSLEPTASDRLYVYRFVFLVNFSTAMSAVQVNSARVLCAVRTREEPAHEYIMRLLRSYNLQNGPDED
tara:strand:- start:1115 stop:1780 length:666 start_codon:yes stop_codon:yes gene_type:complete